MATGENIVIGIDLGTTFSAAAVVRDGKPKMIPSEKGYLTVPSVVSLTKRGDIIVGQAALDQTISNVGNTVFGSKRLVGRKFNSLVVQQMLKIVNYAIVEGQNAEAAVKLGDNVYSLTQVSGFILEEVREMAQRQLGVEIKRAVITVPAYYNDNQRQAVIEAGKLAGLKVEKIVNEPTAAAVAYAYNRKLSQRVLVFDMGGGTFDISILQLHANDFKVLATGGDTFLGGTDFDAALTDFVIQEFKKASGKDISAEKVAVERVRAAAERAKRELSTEKVTAIELPYLTEINKEPVDLRMKIKREQLVDLTRHLVERAVKMCEDVLTSVKMTPKQIDEILLVGGQTRMPLVQELVEGHFGKPPRKGVHPDEVVALGAAILGEAISNNVSEVALHDVLSIPIGVALPNGKFKPVLPKNIALPASRVFKLTLTKEAQIEIDIYQGEAELVWENEYLGTFKFPPPVLKKGAQKLEMRFDLTEDCLLGVTATDLETGAHTEAAMVTLQAPKSLVEGMKVAMGETNKEKPKWLEAFAHRILGK
jgi:molecular chaperone DnaK